MGGAVKLTKGFEVFCGEIGQLGKGLVVGGDFGAELLGVLGPGGQLLLVGSFFESGDGSTGEIVLEAGEPYGIGALALGNFGGLAEFFGASFLTDQAGFHSLGWNERVAGADSLLLKPANGGVVFGELLGKAGGAFPSVSLGFLLTTEFFGFGELGFCRGFLLAEVG